jgi:hypothetical protein
MSRLADVKNMNESIVQGDIYEKQKNLTLGTFKSLQGNDNKTIYKSIETFLSDSLQTDGDDEQVGDNETYSDLTLSELYSIYKDKVELLEAELETLNNLDDKSLYSSSGIYNDGEQKYFYTEDSGTYSFQDIWQGDSAMDTIAGTDSLTDSTKFPDSINLTCGLMAETDDDTVFGDSALPTPEDNDDLAKTDAVCNPFLSGADNFSKAILYITQLNEIVSQMRSKADGSDDSLNIDDLDKSLKDYQARYNFMLKYKTSSAVAASNSDDISNKPGSLRDSSSGYLEAETLKYDSAKMLYVSLLLGSVVAGAITVSTIINSNN